MTPFRTEILYRANIKMSTAMKLGILERRFFVMSDKLKLFHDKWPAFLRRNALLLWNNEGLNIITAHMVTC